jgi:hypothetical protein
MTENFKDPNQLDMFAGVLLTPDQQQQVDNYIIANQDKNTLPIRKMKINELKECLLKQDSSKVFISKMISNHTTTDT